MQTFLLLAVLLSFKTQCGYYIREQEDYGKIVPGFSLRGKNDGLSDLLKNVH